MPLRTSPHAPVFNPDSPQEVVRYFEDVEQLCEAAGYNVPGLECIRYALRYLPADVEETWRTLDSCTEEDYEKFKKDVLDSFYPGAIGDDRRYTRAELDILVASSADIPMDSRAQLGEYFRRFSRVSSWLRAKKRISDYERDLTFMRGFHPEFDQKLRSRLSIVKPDQHYDDPYPLSDVRAAAEFLLASTSN
ncbi:hypothetical protein CALVIDRAFT_454780, partial [Calocera viscosa TUFC12733]